MKRALYVLLICVLIAAAFALGLFFAGKKNQKPEDVQKKSLELNAFKIKPQDITVSQKYIGYVTPIHEAVVQPFISGFIEKIYVKGGQTVQKGDVLVVLKQDEYEAALKRAYADVLKAEAEYQNKQSYFKRIQKADKAVSAAELENAEAAYLSAAAAFEQAKAGYELAKVNYDYTLIRAPITGVVGDVSLTEGNYVSPATPALLSIVQYSPIRVVFSVSDNEYLSELKKDTPFADEKIRLELPNGEMFKNTGSFQYTGNTLDKQTNSMAIYADFKNIGKILTPNTYVTVWLEKNIKNAISLSKDNVVLENKGNFVYLIRGDKVRKVPVEILSASGNQFILKNTFENKDKIITDQVLPSYLNEKVSAKTGA
ncbi:MAG TPA: hypothetical protein DIC64_04480 [Alphaproteobacteria bacterium]|nr:hypothetical protein [Alphaproteobacteria bacterium]